MKARSLAVKNNAGGDAPAKAAGGAAAWSGSQGTAPVMLRAFVVEAETATEPIATLAESNLRRFTSKVAIADPAIGSVNLCD